MKIFPAFKDLRTTAMKAFVLTYSALMAVWWIKGVWYEPIVLAEWLPFTWLGATVITMACSICLRRSNKTISYLGMIVVIITFIWGMVPRID